MKKILFYSVLIFLLLLYIYSLIFDVVPLSSKIILEVIGFFACFKFLNSRYRLKKEYKKIIRFVVIIVIWDIAVSMLNGQTQFHLTKYVVPVIGSFFGAQLIYSFSQKRINAPDQLLLLIAITIFIESLTAILMKLVPPFYSLLDSFLLFDFHTDSADTIFDLARFFGLGNAYFFGALPSCCLGVFTIVYLLDTCNNGRRFFQLLVMWVIVSITSFFSARWAITLIGLSVVLFLLYQSRKKVANTIGVFILMTIVIFAAYSIVINNIDSELQGWAFSFLTGEAGGDHSAEYVTDWWINTKFDFKTFIIGDGLYDGPNGGYYNNVDVGFFREIFYGGIIGLLLFLGLHAKILYMAYKYNPNLSFRLFLIFLFLGYLAILGKGDTNMMSFFILYLVFYTGGIFEKRECNKTIKRMY